MFQKKYSLSEIMLIAVNLVPLYGVWFEGWNPLEVFIVYCLETVILGITTIIKLALVSVFNKKDNSNQTTGVKHLLSGFFIIIFFILHYGFFIFVQTQIFMGTAMMSGGSLHGYADMFHALGPEGYLLIGLFTLWYLADMVKNFIVPGNYRTTPVLVVMFQPYGRIFFQQFVVIVGSMFLVFGLPKIFILVFVIIKIWADLHFSRYLSLKMDQAVRKLNLPGVGQNNTEQKFPG